MNDLNELKRELRENSFNAEMFEDDAFVVPYNIALELIKKAYNKNGVQ